MSSRICQWCHFIYTVSQEAWVVYACIDKLHIYACMKVGLTHFCRWKHFSSLWAFDRVVYLAPLKVCSTFWKFVVSSLSLRVNRFFSLASVFYVDYYGIDGWWLFYLWSNYNIIGYNFQNMSVLSLVQINKYSNVLLLLAIGFG